MSALAMNDEQAQLVTSVVRTLTDADDGSRQLLRLVVEHDALVARRLGEATQLFAELLQAVGDGDQPTADLGRVIDRIEAWLDKERK